MSFTFLLFYFRFCDIINTIILNFFKISEIFVEVIRLNDESARKEKRGMDTGALCYRRYLDGDESGFDELIHLYHDHLIYFIHRYVKNFEAAEDLAADTFMELIVHKKRYAFKSSFKTYLFSIAKNKAIDYLRREKRWLHFSPDEMPTDYEPSLIDYDSVERTVITNEEMDTLRAVIDTLHTDYATFLHLSVFEGLSLEEIAKIMKKTKKQITNLAHRARQALKDILGKEEIANEKP